MGEDLKRMIDAALQTQKGGEKKQYDPFPPKLKLAVGETAELLVIKELETRNKFGGGTRIVRFVINRDGDQFILPDSSGVTRELIKAKCGVGDFVYLRFDGEKQLKNPIPGRSPFKAYTVVVIAKDAFAKTGEVFAAPKPVPKPVETPQASAPQQSGVGTQAPTSTPAAVITGSSDKDVKRLADAVAKYPTGMKAETFQRLYRQVVHDETKTTADALLDHADLFTLGKDAAGVETVQRVQ